MNVFAMADIDRKMMQLGFEFPDGFATPPRDEDIQEFEREVDTTLPAEYRQFLAKYSFARFKDDMWQFWKKGDFFNVVSFSGLADGGPDDLRGNFDLGLKKHELVIAQADGGDIAYQTKGPNRGAVYYVVLHEIPPDGSYDLDSMGDRIANSFSGFIEGLQPATI
jgi:hypothetical protein